MTPTLEIRFEREVLDDTTRLKAWVASSTVLPKHVFLYEYDNVTGTYLYDRVCRYADLANWRTARVDVDDRYIRREYAYLTAGNDSTINELEATIREQAAELLADLASCTDGVASDEGFSTASGGTFSGWAREGAATTRLDFELFLSGSEWPCMVLVNESSGWSTESTGALLAIATVRDMEDLGLSGSGSGATYRASSGVALMPNDRLSEFLAFMSGDMETLLGVPEWDGTTESLSGSTTLDVYLPEGL